MRQLKDLGLIIAYELHGFRNDLETAQHYLLVWGGFSYRS